MAESIDTDSSLIAEKPQVDPKSATSVRRHFKWTTAWGLGIVGLIAFILLDGPGHLLHWMRGPSQQVAEKLPARDHSSVQLDEQQLQSAGIKIEPVVSARWRDVNWVTGQLAENEDRLAHIHPPAAGVVREVEVGFGQHVRLGDLLAYIDSPAVGTAKLELVQNRLRLRIAKSKADWQRTIRDNIRDFLAALGDNTEVVDLVEQFREKPMGDYRQQVVTAYTRRRLAEATVARFSDLANQTVARKEILIAERELEAATAAYQALREQIRFDSQQQSSAADQQVEEAQTALEVSQSQLLIFGYRSEEVEAMDPLSEGNRLAYFPIKAPLDGVIMAKDVVLSEQVTPAFQLFRITDLSTIWLRASIFENDIGRIGQLNGREITFRTTSYPGQTFTAKVITMGDQVDETTRAAQLLALVDNREMLLKPGMFVEVELLRTDPTEVLQIADSALVEQGNETFVFLARGAGHFERRTIVIGRREEKLIEVKSGLAPNDSVVVAGTFALKSALFKELLANE